MINLFLYNGEELVLQKNNIYCTKNNNSLNFEFDQMSHQIDLENQTFLRENDEYTLFLDILNKKCELSLKKEQYTLQLEVEYAILLKNKNKIEISYLIETDNRENKLIVELEEGR